MNNLVKNNPTAKRAISIYNAKKKIKDNIKCSLLFWSIIGTSTLFGNPMPSGYIKTKIVTKEHKKINEQRITNNVSENNDVKKQKTVEKVHISKNGMAFIKSTETLSRRAYWDVNGITLGWGHKINSKDPKWLRNKKVGDWISKKDADELFEKDMNEFINPALVRITDELSANKVYVSQDFVDGLASLIYNCGEQGIKTTRFYELLKSGKIKQAISCVSETRVYQKGHIERRKNEQAMMNGNYEI